MKRIALISEHASPLAGPGSVDSGGQNVYVAQVARRLGAVGYAVDVFTRQDSPDQPEIYDWRTEQGSASGVRVIHVPAGPARFVRKEDLLPYMPGFTDFIEQFIARHNLTYDLIHANFFMSGLVAADLKRRLDIPFVITFHALGRVRRIHQGAADGFPSERFDIEEQIVQEADAIIAECPQDEEDLIQLYNADPARVSIIPCGFDPEELWPMERSAARRLLKLPAREFVILQLGRMVPRKGVDTVVEALGELSRKHGIAARLVIAGGETADPDPQSTPEIGRLMRLAEQQGVAGQVQFVGRKERQALRQYYSAADVFVSTPWYEPFGITPVEAMACGTPVIGSNVGGIRYTVRHGETGFLTPPRDPETLARRLAQLYSQPKLRRQMGQQAIQRANNLFTWQRVTAKLVDLYERVLVQTSPSYQPQHDPALMAMRSFDQAVYALEQTRNLLTGPVVQAARAITAVLAGGGKVMIAGNGGSAADAQHFAAEFVGRFKLNGRRALPALALTADSAFLTAWANDMGYDQVFSRQIEALGNPGDLLIGISTSGRSRNLIEAFKTARLLGIPRIALLGKDGGELLPLSDLAVVAPATDTARIQEVQLVILHLLCELVEANFGTEAQSLGAEGDELSEEAVLSAESEVLLQSREALSLEALLPPTAAGVKLRSTRQKGGQKGPATGAACSPATGKRPVRGKGGAGKASVLSQPASPVRLPSTGKSAGRKAAARPAAAGQATAAPGSTLELTVKSNGSARGQAKKATPTKAPGGEGVGQPTARVKKASIRKDTPPVKNSPAAKGPAPAASPLPASKGPAQGAAAPLQGAAAPGSNKDSASG
jgi:D-inositol-3-phosphate glycosyltransferase